ncbi:hypothetical protein FQA39_LY13788 [Lamprigera yunnana]|nr:hypothetical protein FQA39_LY13788 [Lamprigera yunnana]
MAFSVLLRNVNKFQSYSLLSKSCLNIANKNIAALSSSLYLANDKHQPLLNKRYEVSILPAVRHMSADHRTLWKVEKLVSLALVGLLPACIASPNELLDNITAIALVAHFYWGMVAIIEDYLRPIVVGKIIPVIANFLIHVLTITTLAGLLFFNYSDIGIGNFVRQVWAIKS